MSQQQSSEPTEAYSIDWVKTAGGALAAVTVAVLLSFLGAAGTLIGAALGSVAATVTTALYSQGLDRSRRAAAVVQSTALNKVGLAQTEVIRAQRREEEGDGEAATAHLEHAGEKLDEARDELEGDPEVGPADADPDDEHAGPTTLGDRLRALGWKRIALVAGGTFLVVVLLLSAFELVAGRSVSQLTGGTSGDSGTTFGNLGGGGTDSPDDQDGPGDGPDQQQTDDGATDEPTDDATEDPTDEPTDEASEEPTEEPTDEATTPTAPTTAPSTPSSSRS